MPRRGLRARKQRNDKKEYRTQGSIDASAVKAMFAKVGKRQSTASMMRRLDALNKSASPSPPKIQADARRSLKKLFTVHKALMKADKQFKAYEEVMDAKMKSIRKKILNCAGFDVGSSDFAHRMKQLKGGKTASAYITPGCQKTIAKFVGMLKHQRDLYKTYQKADRAYKQAVKVVLIQVGKVKLPPRKRKGASGSAGSADAVAPVKRVLRKRVKLK